MADIARTAIDDLRDALAVSPSGGRHPIVVALECAQGMQYAGRRFDRAIVMDGVVELVGQRERVTIVCSEAERAT